MAKPKRTYGQVRGVEVTEGDIADMVEEAEVGYDIETLRRRGPRDLNQRPAAIDAEATESPGIDFAATWDRDSILIRDTHFEWRPPVDIPPRVGTRITR